MYHKWQSFLRYGAWQTEFFVILDPFLSFYHINNPVNQNFEKMKKPPGDIIILQMYTINDNHMMYGSWDMEHNRQNFFHFGPFFAIYPRNNPKNKDLKKYTKKSLEILLHMSAINDNHMMYGSWGIECNWRMFLSSWIISCPFTPLNSPKNQNFEKYKKKGLETLSFYTCAP